MYTKKWFKEELKKMIQEESTSGAAGGYNSKYFIGNNKKYITQLGYKVVDKNKLRRNTKSFVVKDLWK